MSPRFLSVLALLALAAAPRGAPAADPAARPLRVYVAGESIERRNRWVAPPFTASGSLNDRGGGAQRNDNDEYGWMVPMRDRLRPRAPDLSLEFVGSDVWADDNDNPYTGTYPTAVAEPTSAISGTSIPSWLEQRRGELEGRTFCYDLAFASRGGNDFGDDDAAEYKRQLKELVLLLSGASACSADPIVVVTGHMPDDQRGGESEAATVVLAKHRFVERAGQAVDELAASGLDLQELRSLVGPASERSWILPSSARAAGAGTFWTTDLVLRNTGTAAATATVKFLGHGGDGRGGPERNVSLAPVESRTYADVLGTLFGLSSDYGPLLVASSGSLAVQGRTFTPGGGGTFGQSVPVFASSDLIGAAPRSIAGVAEDASFRTNLMLANPSAAPVDADVVHVSSSRAPLASRRVALGPLGFAQLSVAADLGVGGLSSAAFVLSTPTAAGAFATYASAIDRVTGGPRTLLPR